MEVVTHIDMTCPGVVYHLHYFLLDDNAASHPAYDVAILLPTILGYRQLYADYMPRRNGPRALPFLGKRADCTACKTPHLI